MKKLNVLDCKQCGSDFYTLTYEKEKTYLGWHSKLNDPLKLLHEKCLIEDALIVRCNKCGYSYLTKTLVNQ